ncbi:ABC transporter ATP-binding protein [Bradyrhizobium sp. NP1]|uniref:ABC transporter ATP-binding protein n=1 Tax=Bradyrhizobium sp. NP1 TaxID=3049772 RepID=UPI0025A55C8F|nr:ABC transporter ATP-binding protein [Bradyrhizobium sp. NP1]WJR79233.1 ABC transporter ATP-binding protein [Bradyrhizobium sp. NP1]
MSLVLECVGLQKNFGGFRATQGIDLSISRGEIVGVIGANGAGKTTLLNIVSGYLRPSAGQVLFLGADVTGMSPRSLVRRGIARSFQIPQLFVRSTARQNIMLALALLCEPRSAMLRGFDDERLARCADNILNSYGLASHAGSVVDKLPQGVRKLLDIAMATCAEPTLLLLDEPTSGVSSEEKNDLMRSLARRFSVAGMTVLFIEHDMEIVREYASRVIALYDGRIISDGTADTVFADEQVVQLITGHRNKNARS